MKKSLRITVILVLTLLFLIGNNIFAFANEQVSNAQIYQKLLEIEKKVNEIEKRMSSIEQRMTVLETTLKLEVKRLDQRIDHLDQKRIDSLSITMWSIFGFLAAFMVALNVLILMLGTKMGRFTAALTKKEQENKANYTLQKKIKDLETKLGKVIKLVPKAAI